MRCPECGAENQSTIMSCCERCGAKLEDNSPQNRRDGWPREFKSYLVPSILVLLFCCQIGGIIALIYSVGAQSNYDAGRYNEALSKAESAKGWCIASVVLGIVVAIFVGIASVAG